ncbi:MAG TPA: ATP-binding protein [Solirubrobacterales bacterium]|jgi:hypothetical protein|nr:ATP-binding protein [Solirubrobacterales bacterium]
MHPASPHQLELEVPPNPSALIESMRAFGYSLPTAVADLIDNSITADAKRVDVEFKWNGPESTVAVIDDGLGMDEDALNDAMRLGSRNPSDPRDPGDLGRFGLGLKSAGWSVARSLTVVSKARGDHPRTRRWDLDHVAATGTWSLLAGGSDAADRLSARLDAIPSGTVVLLERADRLVGDSPIDDVRARDRFLAAVSTTARHLGMVFHRFLSGRDAITLTVNDSPIEPWDPFLEDHPATQRLPKDTLTLAGRRVQVAPFVLPHVSKLDAEPHGRAAGVRGWNAQQGFYVYRARRLLVAGDWLGLRRMQQEEHYKLARIRVDLENSSDEQWQIDVRKASARIPGPLVDQMRAIAEATRRQAAAAYRFRGKTTARSSERGSLSFVWEQVTGRNGHRGFRVNRKHPVLEALLEDPETATAVERAVRLVEENLPVEAIVMETREHPDEDRPRPFDGDSGEVADLLRETHAAMIAAGSKSGDALGALATVEPFDSHPEIVQVYREELES